MRRTAAWITLMALLAAGAAPAAPAWAQSTGTPAPASAAPAPAAAPKHTAPKSSTAYGQVKSASADSLVVLLGKGKTEEAFVLDASTKITKAGKTIPASDLAANDTVRVGYVEADGKMMAKTVSVRTARTAAKSTSTGQPTTQNKTP